MVTHLRSLIFEATEPEPRNLAPESTFDNFNAGAETELWSVDFWRF